MPIIKLLLFLLVVSSAAIAFAQPSKLTISPCEFEEAYQYQAVSCDVELQNSSDQVIAIDSIEGTRKHDSATPKNLVVPPRGIAHFRVTMSTEADVGFTKRFFKFNTNEPGHPTRNAEAKGFVGTILDEPKPTLDFGIVDLSQALVSKAVQFSSRETDDLRILGIESAPDYLSIDIRNSGREVVARPKKNAPWGLFEKDVIKLSTNSKIQKYVSVAIKADFRGAIVPSLNPVPMGYMRSNVQNEVTIRLTSKDGNEFTVSDIRIDGFKASSEQAQCTPAVAGCKLVKLKISGDQPTGQIGGLVRVQIPEFSRDLSIYAWGMLLKPDTKIVDLSEEMVRQDASSVQSKSTLPDVSAALRASTQLTDAASDPLPPPIGDGPLLKWTVENETLLYGFIVYRSDAPDGKYRRVNPRILRIDESAGGRYQWRDSSAQAGRTYWYYVGTINRAGAKTDLTDPVRVVAK